MTAQVAELVALAHRTGVVPVATEVLADPGEPEPARLQAFAHVIAALDPPTAASAVRTVDRGPRPRAAWLAACHSLTVGNPSTTWWPLATSMRWDE